MPFIGTNAVAIKVSASDVNLVADATAVNTPGAIAFYKDSADRWSALRYYKAAASIVKGVWLTKDTADRLPYVLITGTAALGESGKGVVKGIAAADVSNTGYYSFAYIGGYCPEAAMPTSYASNQPMKLSATYAGRFNSAQVNATAPNTSQIWNEVVLWSLSVASSASANSTGSAVISGFIW